MNTLIIILIMLFSLFGFVLVLMRWIPIIIRKELKSSDTKQESEITFDISSSYNDSLHYEKFRNFFTPEVAAKMKSLCGENTSFLEGN